MRKSIAWGILLFASLLVGTAWADPSEMVTAIKAGDKAKVAALIARGADVNSKCESFNGLFVMPLETAVFFGKKDVAELLIAKGADVNAQDDRGSTPLLSVADDGDIDMAELLIANRADVNAKNKYGATPLERAITSTRGKADMIGLLIANGANVNADNNGHTPLLWAISGRKADIVELLIAKGAEVNNTAFFEADYIDDAKEKQEIKAILQAAKVKNIEHQTGGLHGAFQKAQLEFKGHSDDDSLRATVINLALIQRSPPPIPPEAEAAAGRGAYIFKNAKSADDTLSAAKEFLTAIEAAPWAANYYFNLCTVLEKTPYTKQALHACKLYLVAAPNAADAGDMQQRIAGLQYAADRDNAQMNQRSTYVKAIGVKELYRFGGISRTVSGNEIAMRLIVDWYAAPPKYQILAACLQGEDVYTSTYDLVSTDESIRMCHSGVNMHLLIKPEGEGFVEMSDASGGSIRATLDELFSAKQKAMAQSVMFNNINYQSDGSQGGEFYVPYVQGGLDHKHAGFALYESDCNGSLLKQDPRALPDDFVPLITMEGGGYGKYILYQGDVCLFHFASKTGYHFGDTE